MKRLLLPVLLLVPLLLSAQDLRRIEPKPLPPQPGATPAAPAPETGGSDQAIVAELRGLVFVPRPEAIAAQAIAPSPRKIDTRAVPMLQGGDFDGLVRPYLGRPVTFARMHALVADVVAYYRKHDRIFVAVTVPDQDVSTGVLQVLVVEGKLGRVKVEGARWFEDSEYLSEVRAKPGQSLSASLLNADIDQINQNPFRHAEILAAAGEGVGATDLTLRVKDRFPVRFYAGYEDTGTRVSAGERAIAGFDWGNPFGRADQLSYQFSGSTDFDTSVGHSGSYVFELPWRHTLTLSGAYSTIAGRLPAPLTLSGMSWQTGVRYGIPLPTVSTGAGPYTHTLQAGFDFKESNNNLEFSSTPVTDNLTQIAQWVLDYAGALRDAGGSTRFDATWVYSPGGWLAHDNDHYFAISNPNARAEYTYADLSVERTQNLPWNMSLVLTGRGQVSDGNLIGSEQLSLGGFSAVRGYEEDAAYGDEGYLLKQELRLPPFSVASAFSPKFGQHLVADQLQPLVFHDYGVGHTVHLTPGNPQDVTLESAGLGFRYVLGPYATIRFDYGWQLHKPGQGVVDDIDERAHFSAVFSY